MSIISEEQFETEICANLSDLGWEKITEFNRTDDRQVMNFELLLKQLQKINNISESLALLAINEIKKIADDFLEMNKIGQRFLTEGIKIYNQDEDRYLSIRLVAVDCEQNVYQYFRQMAISDGFVTRIPDVVLFLNGLPICIMELKSPVAIAGIEDAFKQNETLKVHSPKLWTFNVINFLSNNIITKYGSTTASFKYFYGWKSWLLKNGTNPIRFLFNKKMIYQLINAYTFYSDEQVTTKYLAAPHQIRAVIQTIQKLKTTTDNRGGIVWHTQGSGKSLTMIFLAKYITQIFKKATILVVTDRNSLEQQLFQRFLQAKTYLRNEAISIASRKDLVQKLNAKQHFGIFFTTVQKFADETGILSKRDDIFILVDEAHRTQNNIDGEKTISKEKEEFIVKFGYARFMRDAFPNAKITGFTGTPLMGVDKDTRRIFGDYNDIYAMDEAVADGATVAINYEMWKPKILLNSFYLTEMDRVQREYAKTLNENDLHSQQKIDTILKNINRSLIFEDNNIIAVKSAAMIKHYQKRKTLLNAKAMIVANSRKAAYKYYLNITQNNPELQDKTILVITESNQDHNSEMAKAIVKKRELDAVASEFRKQNSKYKIAIVVDMWLTGFDVPDLDVMYLDKVIKWHNLMQAIARVNRTFEDKKTRKTKEAGLIVDYIGIWKYISQALLQYANGAIDNYDIKIEDVEKAKLKLNETFQIVNENYIAEILKFNELNKNEKYHFVMKAANKILDYSDDERNKFIKLARKVKRFFKISYSSISESEATIAKGIEIINSVLTASVLQQDENLFFTIDSIKKAIEQAVDAETADIEILESKLSKNINEVAKILATEAEHLVKTEPRIAIELMKHSLQAELQKMDRIRPVFAKRASIKLREIIEELQKTDDIESIIEMLRRLAKDITAENSKILEFTDPQLQAFFEVVANDEYLMYNKNSETLRKIAIDLMTTVKMNITDQFQNNPKVQAKVLVSLKKMLKNKYGYPPEKLGGLSGILIDRVKNEIRINENYFRKDD